MAPIGKRKQASPGRAHKYHSVRGCIFIYERRHMTNTGVTQLSAWLQVFAAMQLGIGLLNLFLGRIFHWKQELARVSLLLREVVHVHAWFISATLAIFAVMT